LLIEEKVVRKQTFGILYFLSFASVLEIAPNKMKTRILMVYEQKRNIIQSGFIKGFSKV
jgi:hypothetical protein